MQNKYNVIGYRKEYTCVKILVVGRREGTDFC